MIANSGDRDVSEHGVSSAAGEDLVLHYNMSEGVPWQDRGIIAAWASGPTKPQIPI